jgi:hypothetical protein
MKAITTVHCVAVGFAAVAGRSPEHFVERALIWVANNNREPVVFK